MWSKMFFVTVAALWSLATATAYSILEPVSDDGWNNYLSPRSTSFENLKLTASEHFVWSSPTGKQPLQLSFQDVNVSQLQIAATTSLSI